MTRRNGYTEADGNDDVVDAIEVANRADKAYPGKPPAKDEVQFFNTKDLQTQEALIREVWGHVDASTKKALANKFATRLFEAAAETPVLLDEAQAIVARMTREMVIPQDVQDQVQAQVRNLVRGEIERTVERTVKQIAQEAAARIVGHLRVMP
ncbi:MAG: hypothetical protein WC869_16085 [Phycisphaerae bacterium]|jgi:hypothetical protein